MQAWSQIGDDEIASIIRTIESQPRGATQ